MRKYLIPYLTLCVLSLAAMAVLLCLYPKTELHLWLNSCHTDGLDRFFRYYTQLAEWPLYLLACLPLLFKRWQWTAFYAASEGISALIITIVKHIFRMPRPVVVFGEDNPLLPRVADVHLHHSNSFPSGHSATFLLFATVCVLLLACHYSQQQKPTAALRRMMRQLWPLFLLLLALLGAYSRIYLSQHFLMDVFAGTIIGICVPLALWAVVQQKGWMKFSN